ncbi:hypothetical protein C0J52_14495 [Blattella germanica]|nr:hypothetical protein C0J52_14495 [Blattella germanica]
MVSGGMSCVKYLLFVFNLIFLITGIAILAIGGIIQDFYSDYSDLLHGKFFVAPVLLLVVGVIIFIVAFFGCCGAIKENHCMIMTTLPDTCCKNENPCTKEYSYQEGCLPKLQKEMENYAILLGGVGIGVACIQVGVSSADEAT